MTYVKTKYAHLEAQTAEFVNNLQYSNQQLGMAVLQALKERDEALAQVRALQEAIQGRL